jgi:hypothetical protein
MSETDNLASSYATLDYKPSGHSYGALLYQSSPKLKASIDTHWQVIQPPCILE